MEIVNFNQICTKWKIILAKGQAYIGDGELDFKKA